ncbi:oxidation resistance protein 1-like isoform X2 [Physella acuta]|uniref:oxidation resistance protein 1-like isoform X2 n=1 Tax=Physella acuta TaxID=109671 RepID=UPI0027DE0C48|nr:oxidation resistance protein 1-like isoform X2 [Physella acuta]
MNLNKKLEENMLEANFDLFQTDPDTPLFHTVGQPAGNGMTQPPAVPARPLIIISAPEPPEYNTAAYDSVTDDVSEGQVSSGDHEQQHRMVETYANILATNSAKIESMADLFESQASLGDARHHDNRKKEARGGHHEHGHLMDLGAPLGKYFDISHVFSGYKHMKQHKGLGKKMKHTLGRFRSGSVESDKGQNYGVALEEPASRSRSYSSTDSETSKRDNPANSPRPYPKEGVWVTNASHPSPLSPPPRGAQGLPVPSSKKSPGFLSDLSLQSTPVDAGASPTSRPRAGSTKDESASPLSATELHNSVLSALSGKGQGSPQEKAPVERKVSSKLKPKGTFEYTVKDGDTLVRIGAHFDVTPSELIKLNRLVSRTVFTGQTLFIPDPTYVPSDPPTPHSSTPPPDTRPKVDVPLVNLADRPMPSIPGHAVPVSPRSPDSKSKQLSQQRSEDETDKECMQKFVKGPARRVLEFDEEDVSQNPESIIVKGTLLVTPNAVMFDPDANDYAVINHKDPNSLGMVVYMDEIKSVALFHDISPRMFWRQPKEIRAHSPKPTPYRTSRPTSEVERDGEPSSKPSPLTLSDQRPAPDGESVGDSQQRPPPDGADPTEVSKESKTGRTSEELEVMSELPALHSDSPQQQGRASEEVENALTQPQADNSHSPLVKQMSRSSELEVSEMALLQDSPDGFGETRDFGGHMGRSSSEVHRHTSSSLGRVSDSSPGDMSGRQFFVEHSDSASDTLGTPTQGFAPLHFTDRSPKSVLAHPKPVPGQRGMLLPQSPAPQSDLKTQKILEDSEANVSDFQSGGHFHAPNTAAATTDSNTAGLSMADTEQTPAPQSTDSGCAAAAYESSTDTESILASADDPNNFSLSSIEIVDHQDCKDEPSKFGLGNPLPLFSPLRTPAQQLSNIIVNYTTNFIRSATSTVKSGSFSSPSVNETSRARTKSVPVFPTNSLAGIQLRSGFTKEDMEKALGPDPKNYLPRSDSPHFEQPPLYLQIRPGIKRGNESRQPRAFDHRKQKLIEEYWLIVPREMGDKLYSFLMEWQPEAYGDQDETEPREKFFFDIKEVEDLIKPLKKSSNLSLDRGDSGVLDGNSKEFEKTWEILSKEEVYSAEKSNALSREDTIDESQLPELIGQSQFIEPYHVLSLVRSLPRNMTAGYNWELTYATHKHGYSLQNLYQKMENVDDSPVILFIRDTHKCVFGAFLSHLMKPCDTFYGSGSTFLFTFYPEYKKYTWQGDNQFFIHGTKENFAVGSGEGLFGLWLDSDLNKGRSHECTTFHNEVLTKEEDFTITDLEVWRFVEFSSDNIDSSLQSLKADPRPAVSLFSTSPVHPTAANLITQGPYQRQRHSTM